MGLEGRSTGDEETGAPIEEASSQDTSEYLDEPSGPDMTFLPDLTWGRPPVCGKEINLPEMGGRICELDCDRIASFVFFANANHPNWLYLATHHIPKR